MLRIWRKLDMHPKLMNFVWKILVGIIPLQFEHCVHCEEIKEYPANKTHYNQHHTVLTCLKYRPYMEANQARFSMAEFYDAVWNRKKDVALMSAIMFLNYEMYKDDLIIKKQKRISVVGYTSKLKRLLEVAAALG